MFFFKESMDKVNIFVKSYLLIKSYFDAVGKTFIITKSMQ